MDILVIDNYDSFTYNLVQFIGEARDDPEVVRNDKTSLAEIRDLTPDAIVISPGPGNPDDAGISNDVIKKFGDKIPTLGVCLGHQCIAAVLGGTIRRADRLLHGKTSQIFYTENPIYRNIENPFTATRYHSLLVDRETLPDELQIDAVSEANEIMGMHHTEWPLIGVQFHPESVLTEHGRCLIRNFLDFAENPSSLGRGDIPIPTPERDSPE